MASSEVVYGLALEQADVQYSQSRHIIFSSLQLLRQCQIIYDMHYWAICGLLMKKIPSNFFLSFFARNGFLFLDALQHQVIRYSFCLLCSSATTDWKATGHAKGYWWIAHMGVYSHWKTQTFIPMDEEWRGTHRGVVSIAFCRYALCRQKHEGTKIIFKVC